MKRTALLILLVALTPNVFAQDERLERLSPEHRKWIEEEVTYIITDSEKDVFLMLETVEERNRFIEAFWRKRDPNRATVQNEFKIEHYLRLEYANKFLGRETFRPGWRTDRGRYYIILGKPREVQRFDGYAEVVSIELWFYEGDPRKGLPAFFYLMFFKRHDVGEYRLYHPLSDGPEALLSGGMPVANGNMEGVINTLREVSPELARASLSYDTSERGDPISGRPSLGTEIMLANVEESPKRAIHTDYADAWRRYGNRVSAEYSFNYVPSRSLFAILVGPENTPFLHYSIEIDAQNFTMETDENRTEFYTTLDVSLEVRDLEEQLVVVHDKPVFLKLTPSQAQQIRTSPFSYQDDFPLVPGDYKVSVILRNRILKQYTVAEQEVQVPSYVGAPTLSDIVLGFRTEQKGQGIQLEEMRTFQVGSLQVYPSADHVFPLGETVHAFLQVVGADPDYGLKFSLSDREEALQERSTRVGDYQGGPVLEPFTLTDMVGGTYELRVELVDPSGSIADWKSAMVQVSPRSSIMRPWNYRASFNTTTPGLLELAKGDQLWKLKRYQEAQSELEKAVAAGNEALPMARWKLAEAHIRAGRADPALELLLPMEEALPQQYEVIAGIGYAYYLKVDYPRAVAYLERAMGLRPADTTLLNALGESYLKVGSSEKAKPLFERSLDMNPDQEAVRQLLAAADKG
jgi:GWxTD domain-containing protein